MFLLQRSLTQDWKLQDVEIIFKKVSRAKTLREYIKPTGKKTNQDKEADGEVIVVQMNRPIMGVI